MTERDPRHVWSTLVAGVGSGALASVLCAPLDLLRTRLQVWGGLHQNSSATSIVYWEILREMIAKDGVKGCFRGLGATLLTVPAFWGVYFPLYDDLKRRWHGHATPSLVHLGSAVTAGAVSDVICNPMFVVRTRLQTESLHHQRQHWTIRQTIASLYREGGLLIFWRGMSANLLGLSHVAVQFPAYELLKQRLQGHKPDPSALDVLWASALSKMTASWLTYPHEVIRSRMMDSREPSVALLSTCRHIYRTEGYLGFYSGLPVSLLRVIPNTCITFLTYEMFLQWARKQIDQRGVAG